MSKEEIDELKLALGPLADYAKKHQLGIECKVNVIDLQTGAPLYLLVAYEPPREIWPELENLIGDNEELELELDGDGHFFARKMGRS